MKRAVRHQLPPGTGTTDKAISYETLVELVRENGGQLKIDLLTTDVGRDKKCYFTGQAGMIHFYILPSISSWI